MSSSAAVAARVAGAIGALGYLLGVVDGPVIGALAGLALVAFGRGLSAPPGAELLGPACFGVLAGAAGSAALRWGTLDLPEIQGAQGVLGPTVVVEPVAVAVMSGAALVASTLALGVWMGEPERGRSLTRWWWVELAAGALLLATLFSGPPPSDPGQAGIWLGAATVVGASATVIGRPAAKLRLGVRFSIVGVCAAVVAGAAVASGTLS